MITYKFNIARNKLVYCLWEFCILTYDCPCDIGVTQMNMGRIVMVVLIQMKDL